MDGSSSRKRLGHRIHRPPANLALVAVAMIPIIIVGDLIDVQAADTYTVQPAILTAIVGCAITAIGTIGGWLWHTSSTGSATAIQLGITTANVTKLQADTQRMNDQCIRTDTQMTAVLTQLTKLDQIGTLVASVESIRSTVDRLDSQFRAPQGAGAALDQSVGTDAHSRGAGAPS